MTRKGSKPVQGTRPEHTQGLFNSKAVTVREANPFQQETEKLTKQNDFILADTLCRLILTEYQWLDIVRGNFLMAFGISLPSCLSSRSIMNIEKCKKQRKKRNQQKELQCKVTIAHILFRMLCLNCWRQMLSAVNIGGCLPDSK